MSGKELNQFLKDRGLKRAWSKYQRIPRKVRKNLNINGEKVQVIVYKRNGRTYVDNAYDLRPITRTKRFNMNNIESGFRKRSKVVTRTVILKNGVKEKRDFKVDATPLKMSFIRKENLKKFALVHSDSLKRKKEGYVFLKINFKKGKRHKIVSAYSSSTRPLVSPRQRRIAWSDAYRRCVAQIDFSPDDYDILEDHYIYLENNPRYRG